MDKNILLVFLLMAVAIFGAQYYMRKYAPQPPQQQRSTARPVEQPIQPGAPSTPSAGAQVRTTEGKSAGRAAPAAPQQATSESETVIENDLYRITLTNRGAEVRSWILKKFKDDQGKTARYGQCESRRQVRLSAFALGPMTKTCATR
jgi:YidC/Oxa1 family membrane protein insertase